MKTNAKNTFFDKEKAKAESNPKPVIANHKTKKLEIFKTLSPDQSYLMLYITRADYSFLIASYCTIPGLNIGKNCLEVSTVPTSVEYCSALPLSLCYHFISLHFNKVFFG